MGLGKRHRFLLLSIIVAAGVILGGACLLFIKPGFFWKWHKDTVYIAVVGPMTGAGMQNGQAMLNAVRLYLDKVNERKSGFRYKVRLKVFDDGNDIERAERIAKKIVKDPGILAVLGHYYSSTSLAAAPIYNEAKIPIITASATADAVTQDNEWYFRTIPNNSTQGIFIANYVAHVMEIQSAAIIADEDAYGASLSKSFTEAASEVGIDILKQWTFNREEKGLSEILADIAEEAKLMEEVPEMFFLATHAPEGARLITLLKTPSAPYLFFGADAFSTTAFLDLLKKLPQERARPGYFSDGIYMIAPFLINIANEKAQEFSYLFEKNYGRNPGSIAAGYYDATFALLEAINNSAIDVQESSPTENRKRIRDYLAGLYGYEQSLDGVNGPIFFDPEGDVVAPRFIALYTDQQIISAFSQYQLARNARRVENLLKRILNHEIFLIGEYILEKTRVVYTGIDINEISDLNMSTLTYTLDFFLWFRFQGEFDDKAVEFVNAVDPVDLGEPLLEYTYDDITTRSYRIKTTFKTRFVFLDYPFDEHTLSIRLRHKGQTRSELIYAADILGMRETAADKGSLSPSEESIAFSDTTSWRVLRAWFFQDIISNDSTLGVPELFNTKETIDYSQFNASVQIKRETLKFITKQLFPIMLLALVAYLAYSVPMTSDMRVNIGMSMLLTSTFFHIQVTSGLEASYLLAIDYIFFTMYGLAILLILISMATFNINHKIKRLEDAATIAIMEDSVKRHDRFGRSTHVMVIILLILIFIYIYGR